MISITELRDRARDWSATQWAIRAVVTAGVLLATVVTALQPGQPAEGLVAIGGLVGLALVVLPQAIIAPVFHMLIMIGWLVLPGDRITAAGLLAAAGLITVQLGCAVAGSSPPHLPVPTAALRPYAVAGVVLLVLAGMCLAAVWLIRSSGIPGNLGLMIMAVLGVAGYAIAVLRAVRARPDTGSADIASR